MASPRALSVRSLQALAGTVLAFGVAASGCNPFRFCANSEEYAAPSRGSEGGSSGTAAPSAGNAANTSAAASRAVSEADIVQLDGDRNWLYAISRSGTLAVVDASQPRSLTILGKAALRGVPFEMYRRDGGILVLSNQGVRFDGGLEDPLAEDQTPGAPNATSSALLQAVDLSDPASPKTLGTLPLPGEIADSRVVGNVLYVATYENGACFSCGASNRTVVSTFDIADPARPKPIDQVTYEGQPTPGAWTPTTTALPWKRSIVATKDRLYVGGIGTASTSTNEGLIEVLDISDPNGRLKRGASISVAGPVLSRWQMDEHEGVLRVVSQRGSGRTINGEQFPDVDTFRIESATSLVRIGHTTMTLPRQEGLKTVRFDGARAYAITFPAPEQPREIPMDPLFTLDLSDPAKPTQKGELEIPGWVFHIVPRGNRLIGLGLDRGTAEGQLNVSLFDVSDMTRPSMLQRVAFGPKQFMVSDQRIVGEMMAEDQDRIQKAFRVFEDGLIAVPYSDPGEARDACTSGRSGVQLLDFTERSLTKRALLPVSGNPRRALRRDSATTKEMLAISDAEVVAFDIARRDTVVPSAAVTIGRCVPRALAAEPAPQASGGGGGSMWEGVSGGSDSSSCR